MTDWKAAEEALDGVQEFAYGKPASWEDHVIRIALARGRKLEEERDVYEIALVKVSEWIDAEKVRYSNVLQGGQIVGDSHSPRAPWSVLLELERMIRVEDARYTYKEIWKLQDRKEKLEEALKALTKWVPDSLCSCEPGDRWPCILHSARALLAEGEPLDSGEKKG